MNKAPSHHDLALGYNYERIAFGSQGGKIVIPLVNCKAINTFNTLGIKCIGDGADIILIVFQVHVVGQVGIALKSPGNIAGAELVALPLFPKVEQLLFGTLYV